MQGIKLTTELRHTASLRSLYFHIRVYKT